MTRKNTMTIIGLLYSILYLTASMHAYRECAYGGYAHNSQWSNTPTIIVHANSTTTPNASVTSARDRFATIKNNQYLRHHSSVDDCYSWSAQQFAAYFKDYLHNNEITPQYIFNLYCFYNCDEFLAYIQTLRGYEDHILTLYNTMQGSLSNKRKLANCLGYGEERLSDFLSKNVQRIRKDRQEKIAKACKEEELKKQAALKREAKTQQQEEQKKQQKLKQQEKVRQETIKNFARSNVYKQSINALETNNDYRSVAMSMDSLAQQVFTNAQTCNYKVAPEVEQHMQDLINGMKTAHHPYELAFNVAMTDQVLHDIQQKAVLQAGIKPTCFDRAPALLMRAAEKFIRRLNPVTQITNWTTSIIDIARFTSTIALGRYYLSDAEYADRINEYWRTYEALSFENFAALSAEQWVDLGAEIAADLVFGMGVGKAAVYLKEINAVAKAQQQATQIANRMKKAVSTVMKERPIVITAEGLACTLPDKMSAVNDVIKNKVLYNFSDEAAKHMTEQARAIPIQILQDILNFPMHVLPDPRGSTASMFYSQMWKNGKLYNVEVLYHKETNAIWHFLYKETKMGPLPKV